MECGGTGHWRQISFRKLFFAVITTRYSNPVSIKRSKASLINDDNPGVFNGFLQVIGTDTKYTIKCSALTDD